MKDLTAILQNWQRADQSGDQGRNRAGGIFLQKMLAIDYLVAFEIQGLQQMWNVFLHS